MASSRIKGITVEIGGDTVGLQNALKEVNTRTKEVQTELKDVERLLKFDPNNVELLAQRQQLLTEAVQSTTDKLNQLKSAEAQVQAQFERGEISQEQYRGFRRELQQTEQQLNGYQQALADMDTEQQRVEEGTRNLQTLFQATGTSVEDYANVIGQRLVRAINDGTATSRDLEYAFQRIGQQTIGTRGDIERLRTTLASVDSGNSIQNIRSDLQQLQTEAEEASESVEGIGDSLESVAGALVAGGGIAGAIEQALDTSSMNTKIDISMEIDKSSMSAVKESVKEVTAAIGDEEAALEGVRRQWALNKNASDETNSTIISGAATITKAYGDVDFTELIQETNEISAALKITDEEALGLVNSLLKMGFPPDQLDIIAEYGTQLERAGYSAEEIQAIMMAGVQTDSWNIDVLLDGLKEGRIVLAEFGAGVDEATAELLKGTGISTKQLQEWGKAVAAGGEGGSKAMVEVAKALEGVSDETSRNLVGVKLFGTLYEEHGSNLTQSLINAQDATVDLGAGVADLAKSSESVQSDPAVKLAQAMQDVKTAAEPTLAVIADIISKIAGWISENPKLAATISSVATGLGIVIGAVMALAPIIFTLQAGVASLGIGMAPLIGIIAGIAVGIPALIAAGVALYQNWDTIEKTASTAFGSIKTTITNALSSIQETFALVSGAVSNFAGPIVDMVISSLSNLGSSVMAILNGDFAQLGEFFKMILPTLIGFMVGGIPGLIISASRFLPAIAEGMESNKGVLIETINGVVASIIEFLEVGLPQLIGAGLTIILNLIEGIISALPSVIEAGVSLIQSLIQGIGEALPLIIELSLQVITSLVTTIAQALPQVIEAGIGILNAVIEGITSILPLLIGAALLLITSIVKTLIENLPKIISAGVEILTALIKGIASILPSLIKTAINLVVTIVKTLAENLPKIISAGVEVLEALIDGIIKILPTLIQTAINLVIQIAKAIIDNLPTILSAGKDILLALIDGIISIVFTLLSTITNNVVKPILNKFEDIDLLQIGKDIIQGLIDGVASKASAVYSKIGEIANNIKDKFTGLFDINSPSRVFRGYGINLNEGLIQGIQATSAKLNKAVENVYGSISNSAQRMMDGSGPGSSVTSTIDQSKKMYNTINISTNTDSTRSTERMLRRLAYEF
ncbi:hypothetical protein IIE26_05195 [Cytobacillus oceanisediminis]|uniref:hypothetical protein n=1 Tax=Cytobacillus oceanisediminis TaxID=665099 RepID=UPI0018655353|nr:hypothetical protein [Cytobacillus oceanisediminis]QOK28065.1 hypothetical protein IIE26_05195 [Cytobacillus oceanisediminis]